VNVLLLWWGLRGFVHLEGQNWRRLGGMVVASGIMAIVLLVARPMMMEWLYGDFWKKVISMILLMGAGASSYAIGVLFLKVTSVRELKLAFRG